MADNPKHLRTFKKIDSAKPGKPHFPKDVHYRGLPQSPLKGKEKERTQPDMHARIQKGKRGGSIRSREDYSKRNRNKDVNVVKSEGKVKEMAEDYKKRRSSFRKKDVDVVKGERKFEETKDDYMRRNSSVRKMGISIVKGEQNVKEKTDDYIRKVRRNDRIREKSGHRGSWHDVGQSDMDDKNLAENDKIIDKGRIGSSADQQEKDWYFYNEEYLEEADAKNAEKGEKHVKDMARDYIRKTAGKNFVKERESTRRNSQEYCNDGAAFEDRDATARRQQRENELEDEMAFEANKKRMEIERAEEEERRREFLENEERKKEEYENEQRKLEQEAKQKEAEIVEDIKEGDEDAAIAIEKAEQAAAELDADDKKKPANPRKFYRKDNPPDQNDIGYFVKEKVKDYESMLDEEYSKGR